MEKGAQIDGSSHLYLHRAWVRCQRQQFGYGRVEGNPGKGMISESESVLRSKRQSRACRLKSGNRRGDQHTNMFWAR